MARNYMEEHNINWWKTPAETPGCTPRIKNLWHEAKEFLSREIKPKTNKMASYHFGRLLPSISVIDTYTVCNGTYKKCCQLKVIELKGAATGY